MPREREPLDAGDSASAGSIRTRRRRRIPFPPRWTSWTWNPANLRSSSAALTTSFPSRPTSRLRWMACRSATPSTQVPSRGARRRRQGHLPRRRCQGIRQQRLLRLLRRRLGAAPKQRPHSLRYQYLARPVRAVVVGEHGSTSSVESVGPGLGREACVFVQIPVESLPSWTFSHLLRPVIRGHILRLGLARLYVVKMQTPPTVQSWTQIAWEAFSPQGKPMVPQPAPIIDPACHSIASCAHLSPRMASCIATAWQLLALELPRRPPRRHLASCPSSSSRRRRPTLSYPKKRGGGNGGGGAASKRAAESRKTTCPGTHAPFPPHTSSSLSSPSSSSSSSTMS